MHMKQIEAKPRQGIPLGHRGENEARQIIFDLTDYISTYGPGTARLLHQRDGDPAPYIVPAVQSGNTLTWTVTDEDTAVPGTGSAELQWTVNNALAKSDIWRTKTTVALDDGATAPPTGAEGWYQQLIAYIDSLRGEGIGEEQIAAAVEAYLREHPVNVPVTSVNGKIGAVQLTAEDVGALGQDELQTGVDTALAKAKASGEFDGAPGDHGTDGITPTIGANGNWYLGDTDTGKPSRGEAGQAGADGADGAPGPDGKSAYQYAVEGGYTGTEAEFAAKLAAEKFANPNALTFTGAVTGSYDGSAPLSVEIPSGGGGSSGGSGKAKSQILIDQEITELTASLSVTLEHDFHNLTAIINCGSAGAALTADSAGTAVASKIALLIGTTSFSYNSRKVSQMGTSTKTWQTKMIGAEWSDDLSVFKRGFEVVLATGVGNNAYNFSFGGESAMYGTLGTDDNVPRTGKTANIVVNGAYLNVGTRVVLWGEYYE